MMKKICIVLLFLCTSQSFAEPFIEVDSKDLTTPDQAELAQTPGDPRGQVLQELQVESEEVKNIGLVLDSSGSMGQILEKNKTKMFFLKKLMKEFVRAQWKLKNEIGVQVYGSRFKSKCDDILNAIPYSDKSLTKLERALEVMEPVGMTPLHKSIELAVDQIKSRKGPKKIVIVTDGEDTCGGDPCKTAEKLRKEKLDISFFIIALGTKDESAALKKLVCLGDVHNANDSQSFSDAVKQISAKIKSNGKKNLKVISPKVDANVFLYRVDKESGKKVLDRVFYADSEQIVEPGTYEVVVALKPLYKFEKVVIPPMQKVTLRVDGEGEILVNFFGKYVKAQLLDKNNKVALKFTSDVPTKAPIGKWKLRLYRDPFYENIIPDYYVFPNGKHVIDLNGLGVLRIESPNVEGVYVYDQDNVMIDHTLTRFPFVIKTGVYSIHVNEQCSFPKVSVRDQKEVVVLSCPK